MLGWEQALWTVMLWGLANVFHAFAASQLNVQPVVFTCMTFASAALMLTLIGGRGQLVRETLKSPSTWIYGVVLVITFIITIYLYQLVTATEGSLMRRLSVLVALLIGMIFFSRKPKKSVAIGAFFIISGVALVGYGLDPNTLQEVLVILVIASVFQALQIIAAEHHPQTNKSRSVREECRVVGLVMFVVSTVFLIFSVFLAKFIPQMSTLAPSGVDFAHMPTLIAGFVYGIVLIGPIKYFEFTSVRKIKSENFLAVAAFAPIMTYAFEALVSTIPFTGMSVRNISALDIGAAFLITGGAMYVAWHRLKPDYELYKHAKNSEGSLKGFMNHIVSETEHVPSSSTKDEQEISTTLKEKRAEMDELTLKRLDESKLSDEEKDMLRRQELKDAGVIKS